MADKKSHIIKITGPGQFTPAAYAKHAKLYGANAAQFVYASQELLKRLDKRTSVYWYMRGMAIELLLKGVLYESNRKTYSPKNIRSAMGHNLEKLQEEAEKVSLLKFTPAEKTAVLELNRFYYETGDHVLRYPSLLNVITPIVPKDEHDEAIVALLEKLLKLAMK